MARKLAGIGKRRAIVHSVEFEGAASLKPPTLNATTKENNPFLTATSLRKKIRHPTDFESEPTIVNPSRGYDAPRLPT